VLNTATLTPARLNLTAALATGAAAAVAGMASVVSPKAGVLLAAAFCCLGLLGLGRRWAAIFLAALGLLLTGYAFAGRGFAYLGMPPVHLAEIAMVPALFAISQRLDRLRLHPLEVLLVVFMLLGLIRTVPYIPRDGLAALRDGVVWGYALFAIAVVAAVRRDQLRVVARLFGNIAPYFVLWAPVLFVLHEAFKAYLPVAPGSKDASIPYLNPGDVAVHLTGVAGFALLGLGARRGALASGSQLTRPPLLFLGATWLVAFAMCGAISRGAFLAGLVGLGAVFLIRPTRTLLALFAVALTGLLLLAAVNPSFDIEGRQRDVSARQLLHNATSIVGGSDDGALEPTRRWRLAWWREIVDYTLTGPYFWTGKGFGVNLADSDGYQVFADHSLRSPHNTHLTILARMGVPGFVLWVSLNLIWVVSLWRARARAVAAGMGFQAAFIAWLLVYWLAMSVNGAFSLYLEAPQQAIWFWTVFGLGLVALAQGRVPEPTPRSGARLPQPEGRPSRRLVPARGYLLSSGSEAK
jgi:hypothetical protein